MEVRYPSNIILEVAGICNLKCLGCAVHGPRRYTNRPLGIMEEKVWRRVISEIGAWDREVDLTCHGAGEPLLHPHFREILTYAKSFPKIKAGFLTNGMLMDPAWSKFVLSQALDWICFSVDGTQRDTHRQVRRNSDLSLIERNLINLINLRDSKGAVQPEIGLNMVAYDEILDQRQPFIQKWINIVDFVLISHYRDPPSSKRWPIVPVERKPCFLLWKQMVIAWDGRLGMCCEDFNIDFPIGSTNSADSLVDIWNGEAMDSVRRAHGAGKYDSHSLCVDCDTWADDLVYVGSDPSGYRVRCRASQTEYARG